MHILLRHYGQGCEGILSARNILNMATTIKMGSVYHSEKNDYLSISNTFNNDCRIIHSNTSLDKLQNIEKKKLF